jgi:hypothetical protein
VSGQENSAGSVSRVFFGNCHSDFQYPDIFLFALALNLQAYEFVSQEIRVAEDPEFETIYTKNIILNEGAWMAAQDQSHETNSCNSGQFLPFTFALKPPLVANRASSNKTVNQAKLGVSFAKPALEYRELELRKGSNLLKRIPDIANSFKWRRALELEQAVALALPAAYLCKPRVAAVVQIVILKLHS